MKNRLLLFAISILFIPAFIYCEENFKPHQAGIIIGPNLVFNTTQIALIPGADDCGRYSDGNAVSLFGGLFYTYKYIPDMLSFDLRLFYENRPVNLSAESSGYEILDPNTNQYTPLIRKHELTGSLGYIALDAGVKYQPLKEYPAFVRLGFEAGNPIVSANYENTEQIISPEGVLFPDETLKRKVAGGTLTDAGTALGVSLGISYSHQLESGLIIEPGLTFRKSLNSSLKSEQWNQDIVRLSISIGMDFGLDENKPPRPVQEVPHLDSVVKIQTLKTNIIENLNTSVINLQETIVTQTYPILPYLFFDSLQHTIKDKYLPVTSDKFDEKSLPKDNLQIYYRILDIIGSRMKNNPDSKIKINGTQDSRESLLHPDYKLAQERAETVAFYLSKKWGIEPSRILAGFLKKPTLATSESYPEGFEENRRVEFSSDNSKILEPVVHTKFSEYIPTSNQLVLSTQLNKEIRSWEMSFALNDNTIKKFNGTNNIPVTYNFNEVMNYNKLNVNDKLKVKLEVTGKNLQKENLTRSFPVEVNKNRFELGRLNLIVFDFDRFELTDINKAMIKEFVGKVVTVQSKLNITGSTDRLGEMQYNQKLSQSRAEKVTSLLKELIPDVNIVGIKGVGASKLNYDNSTPEGRFYSRTVLIEVETPIE